MRSIWYNEEYQTNPAKFKVSVLLASSSQKIERGCFYYLIVQTYDVGLHFTNHWGDTLMSDAPITVVRHSCSTTQTHLRWPCLLLTVKKNEEKQKNQEYARPSCWNILSAENACLFSCLCASASVLLSILENNSCSFWKISHAHIHIEFYICIGYIGFHTYVHSNGHIREDCICPWICVSKASIFLVIPASFPNYEFR